MHTRKPGLLKRLVTVNFACPQGWLENATFLIDRQGVISIFNARAEMGMEKTHQGFGEAP